MSKQSPSPDETNTRPPKPSPAEFTTPAPPAAANPETATLPPSPEPKTSSSFVDRVSVPGYKILDELGRGGMGVVYKARQVGLNRTVALKMILSGGHASAADLARFRTEAEAVARLQHPNIVQIYDIGEQNGLPYFSLEFCHGGSLDKHLKGIPLPPDQAAEVVETLARAMHAAHEADIIHRDLKPANILLQVQRAEVRTENRGNEATHSPPATPGLPFCTLRTALFIPKITDFGLAKKLDDVSQTQSGAIMGSPSYMAPEQASGNSSRMGPAVDVYALGAILYELLTGRPPFRAATMLDTLLQVQWDEPVPPSQLQSKTPKDLETICLKCLQKEPGKRFRGAAALADDLHRFRKGEPIQARPVGLLEKALKWVKRNPAIAASLAAVVLVTLLGIAGISWKYHDAVAAQKEAASLAESEKNAKENALLAQEATLKEKDRAEKQLKRAETALYFNRIFRVGAEILNLNRLASEEILDGCPPDLRGWEWNLLNVWLEKGNESLPLPIKGVTNSFLSPDGQRLAMIAEDRVVQIADLQGKAVCSLTGHTGPIRHLAFSPDGKNVATAADDALVCLWDAATGKLLHTLPGHTAGVTRVAFSPNSKQVASGSKDFMIMLWDVETGKEVWTMGGHSQTIHDLDFNAAGTRLVSASADGTVKIWNLENGRQIQTFRGHQKKAVTSVAISPDGEQVVSVSTDQIGMLWEIKTGNVQFSLRDCRGGAVFSHDGERLLAMSENRIKIWDRASGQEILNLAGEKGGSLQSMSLSRNGERLSSFWLDSNEEKTGRLLSWNVSPSPEAYRLHGQNGSLSSVAFHPDGKQIAAASVGFLLGAGEVKIWNCATVQEKMTLRGHLGPIHCVTYSPDGMQLASASTDSSVVLWDAETGKELHTLLGHTGAVWSVAYHPDGKRVATASLDRTIRLWDTATGKEMARLDNTDSVRCIAFHPDGKRLVSGDGKGALRFWDLESGKETKKVGKGSDSVVCLAFSPDGEWLASGSGSELRLWKAGGSEEGPTWKTASSILQVAFSPDSSKVAVASSQEGVTIWDLRTGKVWSTFNGHQKKVSALSFSPDGSQLATAGEDGKVKVWDLSK